MSSSSTTKARAKRNLTHPNNSDLGNLAPSNLVFTPADSDSPPSYSPTPTQPLPNRFHNLKSKSSPSLHANATFASSSSASSIPNARGNGNRNAYRRMTVAADSDSESDIDERDFDTEDVGIVHSRRWSGEGSRNGVGFSHTPRHRESLKVINTKPGALCAGETETEVDEPPKHLPTSRIIHRSPSFSRSQDLIPSSDTLQRLTPFLFEFSRLLSIVPAVFGTLYNLYRIYQPPPPRLDGRSSPERVDFAVSALWAILTGYQCLALTTGLFHRWRLYYPPLSTLIRLLALQGICWPATQLTCTILEHGKRPVIVWAVIGTTTCVSRGVQIWVTSNLWLTGTTMRGASEREGVGVLSSSSAMSSANGLESSMIKRGYWVKKWTRRWVGDNLKWGGRRWDWKVVGVNCVLPAGIMYFVMAWAEQLRREFSFSPCRS